MVIKIVAFLIEVLVEHEASRARYVIPVGIEPKMGWGFGLPHVLVFAAFDAISQINAVFAFAIQFVSDFEAFPGLVASEGLCGCYLAAAFVLGCRQAR